MTNMKESVAFVTGGASGLGKATVQYLSQLGCKVVFCDLSESEGQKVAKELGEDVIFVRANVTLEADILAAFNVAEKEFGRLDYIINCAGIAKLGTVYDFKNDRPFDLEDFKNVINVNLVGTFNVIRLGARLLNKNAPIDGQRGVIINTSSIAGHECREGLIAYAASKSAISGITVPLARELASQGIRVCTIAPGGMDAPLLTSYPAIAERFVRNCVTFPKRLGKPSEFAHLVQCIIENQMLNGEVIRLDAGARY